MGGMNVVGRQGDEAFACERLRVPVVESLDRAVGGVQNHDGRRGRRFVRHIEDRAKRRSRVSRMEMSSRF